LSAKFNLVCEQATTFNFRFVIQDNQSGVTTPWNLTNYSATMTVRPFVGAETTTFVATNSNGRINLGGSNGRITVTVDAATTGAIVPGRYAYDLVLNSGSVITRILEGRFTVTGAVTTS
jgi:hypothetical protein